MKWIALAVVAVACGRPAATTSTKGSDVYAAYCAQCHGSDGKPPAALVAQINPRDLTAAEFRARVTPAKVEYQVRRGSDNKLMPSFDAVLSDDQVKAVASWVASPEFVQPR